MTFGAREFKAHLLICKRPHAAGRDMLDAGLELVLETLDQRNEIKPSQKLFFFFRGCKQSSDGCLCDRFVSENVQNRCMWTTFPLDVIVVSDWWHRSSLSPAYSHMPKDYNSIMTALLQHWEDTQTSGNTPLRNSMLGLGLKIWAHCQRLVSKHLW